MAMRAAYAMEYGRSAPRVPRGERFVRWSECIAFVLVVLASVAGVVGCRGDKEEAAHQRISTQPLGVPAAAGEALGHMAASAGPFDPDLAVQQSSRKEWGAEQDEDDLDPEEAERDDSDQDTGEEGDGGLESDGGPAGVDADGAVDGGVEPRSGEPQLPQSPQSPQSPSGKPGDTDELPTWRL